MIKNKLFGPILNIVIETMPRDNLLNSACLEFFEFIKRVCYSDWRGFMGAWGVILTGVGIVRKILSRSFFTWLRITGIR